MPPQSLDAPKVVVLNCPQCGATCEKSGPCAYCGNHLIVVGGSNIEVDPAKENGKQNLALLHNWRQRVENEGENTALVHYNGIDKLNWSGWSIKQVLERCGFWRQGWEVGENMPLGGGDTNNPVAYYILENLKNLAEDDSTLKKMFESSLENNISALERIVQTQELSIRSSAHMFRILLVTIASFRKDLVGEEIAGTCQQLCGQLNRLVRHSYFGS